MIENILRLLHDISLYGLEKMGLYYSQYRGFVADTADPDGYGRIKVSVPEVYGDKTPNIWAWPTSCYSGKGYGMQVIPRKNDLVWVKFEKGNPRRPLWSFGYFGKGDKPDELKDVNSFWFRTPQGHLVELNDTTGVITIKSDKSEIEVQPAVLGDTLQTKIEELIEIIKTMKVNTSLGPQSILPIYTEQLDQLKDELYQIKSGVIKIN